MVPLEASKLLMGLAPVDLERVKRAAQERHYSPGQAIFHEGDVGDGIYIVAEGKVQISALVSHEERSILSRVLPGELFGEMAVMDDNPRSATAIVDEPTVVFFIPRADLLQIIEEIPQISGLLLRDISRRLRDFNKHYIEEVLQSERLELVGRFARTIVHDLKNPLNIISLSAELAGDGNSTVASRLVAQKRIQKQVERISQMVNELMEFTRGSQNSFILATADYGDFVTQTIEELRPEAALRSVEIELEGASPHVSVPINPPRLTRLFHNLVHNAIDAMPAGGVIRISFRSTPNSVITEICDQGGGIAPEIKDKLFQPFATFGKAHGTGLGLSVCKRIVDDHKGMISARNGKEGGAVFTFHLPVRSGRSFAGLL